MNIILSTILVFFTAFYQAISAIILYFVPNFKAKKNIEGQIILITGAGSGLGRQMAIEFSKHYTCLVLVDINKPSLKQTENLLDSRSTAFSYECDVTDYNKVYEMAKKVKEDVGNVDILVNNAGFVCGKYLLDIPEEKIVKTLQVNALAHFWTCKAFLPAMIQKNRGHFVTIVSMAGKFVMPKGTDYASSKYAALGFAECLELELRAQNIDGIKMTVVLPGHIDTGFFEGASFTIGSIWTTECAAKRIVDGVLQDEETIYIPGFYEYFPAFKEILPRWLVIKAYKMTGIISCMKNFTGRQQKDEQLSNKSKAA